MNDRKESLKSKSKCNCVYPCGRDTYRQHITGRLFWVELFMLKIICGLNWFDFITYAMLFRYGS